MLTWIDIIYLIIYISGSQSWVHNRITRETFRNSKVQDIPKTNHFNIAGDWTTNDSIFWSCQNDADMHTSLRTGLHYSNLILMWLEAKDSALSQSFTSKPSLPWSLRVDIWSTELFAPLLAYLRLPVYSVKPWNWILVLWGLRGKEACRRTTRNYSDIKTLYIKWCTGRNGFHSAFAGMSHPLAKKTGWVWEMHSSQHMQLQPLFHWSSSNFHLFVQIFTSHVV